MRHNTLEHRFVRNVPRELEPGVLYISMEYATAVHSCCCGCGDRVVTPFTPTDWHMTFDGESISLHPSVGNWNQKCRSHYVIQRSRVLESGLWSNAQIEAERYRDKKAKAAHYGGGREMRPTAQQMTTSSPVPSIAYQDATPHSRSVWSWFTAWFSQ
jgi:hypothetical protein